MTQTTGSTIDEFTLLHMAQAVRRAGVLCAGMDLAVFDTMADGPADAETVAARLGVPARGARVLLRALAAIELLKTDGERFWLAPGVDRVLVRSSSGYFGDILRHAVSRYEWDALGRLSDAVRRGGTVLDTNAETPDYPFWADLARTPTPHTPLVADLLADALEPWAAGHERLDVLDVACGHGLYGYTVARRYPKARVRSVDWPGVLEHSRGHAERLGVLDRVELTPGDMFELPLGGPYDLTLITNVLHHFSAERAGQMLRRLAEVTRPGGRIGIVAVTADGRDPASDPVPHLFAALMLAWTHEGESHALETYRDLLTANGFGEPRLHEVGGVPLRLLLAERI
ncbi:class I SAM-dependent methyltransferase [Streptomyces thermolilacinus]|uniref:class I SAM-dependent methyltransferase n=1 Tax=Streptomyces thermolilacinus TaxID=285540 RepID=UPI00340BDEF0